MPRLLIEITMLGFPSTRFNINIAVLLLDPEPVHAQLAQGMCMVMHYAVYTCLFAGDKATLIVK